MQRTILQLSPMKGNAWEHYRALSPAKTLCEKQASWRVITLFSRAKERLLWAEKADLLVLFDPFDLEILPILANRKKLGKPSILDIDAHFAENPLFHGQRFSGYEKKTLPNIAVADKSIELVSAVICASKELAAIINTRGQTAHVVQNHLGSPPPFEQSWPDLGEELCLGWAASESHLPNLLSIAPLLREVLSASENLKLYLMGNHALPGLLHLPEEKLSFTPAGSLEDYYAFWKKMHLGMVPLSETTFDCYRSDIKAVEIAANGALPLLQNAPPFENFAQHTEALTFGSGADLKELLLKLLDEGRDNIRNKAKGCYDYVAQNRCENLRDERGEIYAALLKEAPQQAPDFAWPFDLGFHETPGEPQTEAPQTQALLTAKKLLLEKKHEQALAILGSRVKQNPFDAEASVAQLSLLQKSAEFSSLLDEALKRFPSDIRFFLQKTLHASDKEERQDTWKQIVGLLQKFSSIEKTFFHSDIEKFLRKEVDDGAELSEIAVELLEIYPDSAGIHIVMAQYAEARGDDAAALEHFSWLLNAKRIHDINSDVLADLKESYLHTWIHSLSTRTGGK